MRTGQQPTTAPRDGRTAANTRPNARPEGRFGLGLSSLVHRSPFWFLVLLLVQHLADPSPVLAVAIRLTTSGIQRDERVRRGRDELHCLHGARATFDLLGRVELLGDHVELAEAAGGDEYS